MNSIEMIKQGETPDISVVACKDVISGDINTLTLKVSYDKLVQWTVDEGGQTIHQVFPELSEDEREFLMTGLLPGYWDKRVFGETR